MATSLIFHIILSVYITNQHVQAIKNSEAQVVEPLIFYGDDVRIEDYPFYAGLDNCGAVILSNSWILTAAHCVKGVDIRQRNNVWVGGETYTNSLQVTYSYVYIHEGYTGTLPPINDIALIKLSSSLQFTKKIQPIKLPSGPKLSSNLTFVGRGIDETGQILRNLRKVDLLKLSVKECIELMPPQHQTYVLEIMKLLQTTNICTKREGNKLSLCKGDSGGPLISGDTLLGIASFIGKSVRQNLKLGDIVNVNANFVCQNMKLGFFVKVDSYLPWIKSITGL